MHSRCRIRLSGKERNACDAGSSIGNAESERRGNLMALTITGLNFKPLKVKIALVVEVMQQVDLYLNHAAAVGLNGTVGHEMEPNGIHRGAILVETANEISRSLINPPVRNSRDRLTSELSW